MDPEEKEHIKEAAISIAYRRIINIVDDNTTEGRTWDYWVEKFQMDPCPYIESEIILENIAAERGIFYIFD